MRCADVAIGPAAQLDQPVEDRVADEPAAAQLLDVDVELAAMVAARTTVRRPCADRSVTASID
jgi:hypothetical protein